MRRARETAGLSQAAVAERLGIARPNYVPFERLDLERARTPNPATLVALARILDIEPRSLTTTASDEITLRDLREYAGMSGQQAAEALGWSAQRSYYELEAGIRPLTDDITTRLAAVFNVSAAELTAASSRRSEDRR